MTHYILRQDETELRLHLYFQSLERSQICRMPLANGGVKEVQSFRQHDIVAVVMSEASFSKDHRASTVHADRIKGLTARKQDTLIPILSCQDGPTRRLSRTPPRCFDKTALALFLSLPHMFAMMGLTLHEEPQNP